MADCELLATCPFFNDMMPNRPATAKVFKKTYCNGSNAECARYIVLKAVGQEKVPSDLYPNQKERVKEIISSS